LQIRLAYEKGKRYELVATALSELAKHHGSCHVWGSCSS
jgi:hypothetical protein